MPITIDQIKKHWRRLRINDEEELLDVFARLLSPATKQGMVADLEPAILIAKEELETQERASIGVLALSLDPTDPMRIWIIDYLDSL